MHTEQFELLFTLVATLLLVAGGASALLALPWRDTDVTATDNAARSVASGLLAIAAEHLAAPVRYSTSSSRVPRPPAMNSLM